MKTKVIAALAAVILITACQDQNHTNMEKEIFPRGVPVDNNYFTGSAWLQMLMTDESDFDCSVYNVTFEAGCRNFWHSHPGGQILLVTSGEGYYQEEGKSIQLIKTGDVIRIKPDVMHWHGATPHSEMVHIGITAQTHKGPSVWGDAVTDEVYNSYESQ